jgi:hypothetical protein
VLLYRAFVTAMPNGNRKRYALLIFIFPSMCLWPSSLGKEAWMLLFLGVASVGAARLFTRPGLVGWGIVAIGFAGLALVRPHIALTCLIALILAMLIARRSSTRRGTAGKFISVMLLVLGGTFLVGVTVDKVAVDDTGQGGVGGAITQGLEEAEDMTAQGGSSFDPFVVRTPLNYPPAAVTVIFRPFLFEAHKLESMIIAVEGMVVFLLMITSFPRIFRIPRLLLSTPYVTYSLVFVGTFVVAFSSIANFGILARQRVQMLPFLFVLLALPRPGEDGRLVEEDDDEDTEISPAHVPVGRSGRFEATDSGRGR